MRRDGPEARCEVRRPHVDPSPAVGRSGRLRDAPGRPWRASGLALGLTGLLIPLEAAQGRARTALAGVWAGAGPTGLLIPLEAAQGRPDGLPA